MSLTTMPAAVPALPFVVIGAELPPRTAAEAKAMVRARNAEARSRRKALDAERARELEELRAMTRTCSHPRAQASLSPAAIYAARRYRAEEQAKPEPEVQTVTCPACGASFSREVPAEQPAPEKSAAALNPAAVYASRLPGGARR